MPLPRIGLTEGDPSGIGPEISAKAAADPRVRAVCEPVLYGSDDRARFVPGRLSAEAGRAAYEAIGRALRDAQAGVIAGMTTAPINKEALALAGLKWRGHTDMLAELTGASRVAMMFHAERLRVVLATIHVPLAEVPRLLTTDLLSNVMELTAQELPRFGFPKPRLALAGLNPHAGEHGILGREEQTVLEPAVARARAAGVDVTGPFPADTVFVRALAGKFDAVIACYHDQGLIPVKLVAFGQAVNVTLGLPVIRTSVDHGTAFDIAGRGVANPESMIQAVLLAARLASTVRLKPDATGDRRGYR
ncbi:MAG TPA: 4-hydroxythreonine-4-phosphate dehydrogenase PdxA [Vicinamibacterales bacterium]|jgi:4-hydroxythreonine-4-phosphate dehydrogenase